MKDETKAPENVEETQSERNDTRRSVLKGAAAAAAAAVAASVPRDAAAAKSGWPCTASLRGPFGTLTMRESRGQLSVQVVLDGISKEVGQELTFVGPAPSQLRGVNIQRHDFGAWMQNEVMCW